MLNPQSLLVKVRAPKSRSRRLLFNVCPATLVLASYIESRRPGQYTFGSLPFHGPELRAALADPDTVFCLSLCGLDEIHLAEELFSAITSAPRQAGHAPKVVVGGAFFNAVSPEDFALRFPAVSHVVQGDGEEALLHILESDPKDVIVRGTEFPEAGPFRLSPVLPWHQERTIPLRRQPYHCAWDKCRFCFHTDGPGRSAVSMEDFCDSVSEYYHKYGWRKFYIFDNYTEPPDLEVLLRYCEEKKLPVEFDVLGMMLVKPALALRATLERTRMVRYIGWGLESYHQKTLKLYRKGTNVANVKPLLEMARAAGVRNFTFILTGLPQVEREADVETYEFLREATEGDQKLIDGIALSWFLYSPQLSDRLDDEEFGITTGDRYTLGDYACDMPAEGKHGLSTLRTIYARFNTLDQASGRTYSRDELFLERGDIIKKMLLLPGARFDFRSYMIELDTWRKVWGEGIEDWMRKQPRSLVPKTSNLSVVQMARKWRKAQPVCL